MSNYKCILVAVDFSELSEFAAKRAVELAGFYGARLVFLHVIEHFPEHLPHYQMAHEGMDPQEFLIDRAEKDLAQLCYKLGCGDAEKAVRITKHSAKGELLDYAEENQIDLIVLGSQGRRRLNELLAGSTATGIVRSANCDVFTVRRMG